MKNSFLLSLLVVLGLSFAGTASAATLGVSPDLSSVEVGGDVTFSVTINTEGSAVNAAEASLQFSTDLLEVVSVDTSDSIFNFWVEGPSFSNETGRISFLGGSTNGFNGQSLRVVRIHARIKAEGAAEVVFIDGTLAANDGAGTNVLTAMYNASVTGTTASVAVAPPEQITREATLAARAPSGPELEIPLYPDPTLWYNDLSSFVARWELPSDITDVATVLTQAPSSVPRASEGLFDNKLFRIPEDGVWYLHVRFKNNVGWGETAHVRLAVDTLPPVPYQIAVEPSLVSDVPNPVISFESADQLSGLRGYAVQVDGGETVQTSEGTYALPALSPGEHVVSVAAIDQAGNSTSATTEIVTLPIASPTVSPMTKDVYVGEGALDVGGTAEPGVEILVELRHESGELVATSTVAPDENGTWGARFEQPLKTGSYEISATARDARGAKSIPVVVAFPVVPRPFLVLAGVQISQFLFFLVIIVLLAAGYVVGWKVEKKRKEKRGWHTVIAQRDVGSAFDQIEKDLGLMDERHRGKKLGEREAVEMLSVGKRVTERVKRIKQFVLDHIEEINT